MQSEVLQLIIENKLDTAFTVLKGAAEPKNPEAFKHIVALQTRFNRYRQCHFSGTQSFEEMNLEINRICSGLIELVTSNETLFLNGTKEERKQWKNQFTSSVEIVEAQTISYSKSLREKRDYKEKQYLIHWLSSNFLQVSKDIAAETFDLLEMTGKDRFEFEQCLTFAMRFLFKSYLNGSCEWLNEPSFIFNFKQFTKPEARLALVLLREKIVANEDILRKDKQGILERIARLDAGVKVLQSERTVAH